MGGEGRGLYTKKGFFFKRLLSEKGFIYSIDADEEKVRFSL